MKFKSRFLNLEVLNRGKKYKFVNGEYETMDNLEIEFLTSSGFTKEETTADIRKKEQDDKAEKEAEDGDESIPENGNTFKCPICLTWESKSEAALKVHITKKHK